MDNNGASDISGAVEEKIVGGAVAAGSHENEPDVKKYSLAGDNTSGAGKSENYRGADGQADPNNRRVNNPPPEPEPEADVESALPGNISITISAVGDCTIGYDETFGYQGRFDQVYAANGGDPAYFFQNVYDILSGDDLTVANLETVFTESGKKADKAYRFKGPPGYVEILEAGGVEAVNVANNHMFDYFQKGYEDTLAALANSSVQYFGYEKNCIIEVKGIKIGLAGFHIGAGGWSHKKKDVTAALNSLRPAVDILIMSYHWGVEGKYTPTADQKSLARFSIDNGADLVLGHHPHTLQNIEIYNGKTIAYSLGNFCFGGNRNPTDKDSIILQQSFEFDGVSFDILEIKEPVIIPVRVSSVKDRNDYRPTPVDGDDAARVMKKVLP
jgi:poly-gamma-glutamate synthesis protein (capsule biosynthesis protein)